MGSSQNFRQGGRDSNAQPVYPRNFLGLGDGDVQWMWGPDSLEIRENEEEANWS